MKRFTDLIAEALPEVDELFPWDLEARLTAGEPPLLLDVREPYEFEQMRIPDSVNVPRGILETACDWEYDETVPALAGGRAREIVVICRSGNRSVLAAHTMARMGFTAVRSLKMGVRGWNDYDQPLINLQGETVDPDWADDQLATTLRPDQHRPADD